MPDEPFSELLRKWPEFDALGLSRIEKRYDGLSTSYAFVLRSSTISLLDDELFSVKEWQRRFAGAGYIIPTKTNWEELRLLVNNSATPVKTSNAFESMLTSYLFSRSTNRDFSVDPTVMQQVKNGIASSCLYHETKRMFSLVAFVRWAQRNGGKRHIHEEGTAIALQGLGIARPADGLHESLWLADILE